VILAFPVKKKRRKKKSKKKENKKSAPSKSKRRFPMCLQRFSVELFVSIIKEKKGTEKGKLGEDRKRGGNFTK